MHAPPNPHPPAHFPPKKMETPAAPRPPPHFPLPPTPKKNLAWVSGFSGEKGKDESERGRELKERNFSPSPLPQSKISSPLAP